MSKRIRYHVVDAFAACAFSGNPAAVVWLDRVIDTELYLKISSEFNLSETAFLSYIEGNRYDLRWFTPTHEVGLCGHATLAAAHSILTNDPGAEILFETASGPLTAGHNLDGDIALDFPAQSLEPVVTPDPIFARICPGFQSVYRAGDDWMVVMPDEQGVIQFVPNLALLRLLPGRGLIVTASSRTSGFDCVSRFFAPNIGIVEDPVTGSAHCALAPFWQQVLGLDSIVGHQVSARGGVVRARYHGNRVQLSGQCVTVMEGSLCV